MLYLRPQRVYKPSALSYLGDPSDIVDSIIDRYLNKDLYRLRIETPRGTSITADNSQITCYAHIFDKGDGTELTDLLKGRGFHPTWLLDGKPIDSARISEEGYQLTLETDHLPAIYQAVTLQARDTDILLALTTDEIQKRIYSQLIELGSIPTNLLKTSEKLLNISRLDKIRVEGLEEIKQDLAKALASKQPAGSYALTSELATSQQQAVDEAVKRAEELDKKLKVGGRNLIVKDRYDPEPAETTEDYLYRRLILSRKHTFVTGDWYTLSMDVQVPEDAKGLDEYNIFDWLGGVNKYGWRGDTRIVIHNGRNHITFKWGEAGDKLSNTGLLLYRGFGYAESPQDFPKYPITTSNITLVKGTIGLESYVPAPEDLDDSISKVNKSLTSLASTLLDPDQGEIHKLTSQLATSQQQAVDEAVRRAGEMDKQIKVGGRNLLLDSDKSLSNGDYYVGRYDISNPTLMVAGEDYTIQIWGEIEGADYSESIWVYNSGGNTEVASIQKIVNGVWQMTFKWIDDSEKLNRYLNLFRGANHPNNKNSYNTTIIRIKLERGTIATDWTPAPEDLDNSISKLNKSLTSLASTLLDPDQGEIHKLTSQLAASQQQAVDEAVRQAGEMDKKLKVGGRNLIVTSRWKAGYLYGDRDENAYPVGSENYKVLVGYDTFRFDPVYIPTLGEREVTYKLYDNGGSTNGTVQIHAYDKDKKFLWWSCDGWDGAIGHTNAWTLPADTAYIRLGVTNENVRAKVEFGTVVTDWTPAPEDVENTMAMLENSLSLSNEEIDYLKKAVTSKADRLAVDESFSSMIGRSDKRFKNAFDRIFNIDLQLQGIPRIDVDGSGRIAVSAKSESCPVNHGYNPDDDVNLRSCSNGVSPVNIQLVLRSDFDTLKRQVDSLSARIAQLEAGKNVTPVTDTRLRQPYNLTHSPNATLYPLYGDWILTSDVDDQYISFSGLSAEIGRSIYIQTRRKAYLYANNHSFYGLPGTSSSIAVNQWLSNNTTYRFVRASSDSWLVTASSSP